MPQTLKRPFIKLSDYSFSRNTGFQSLKFVCRQRQHLSNTVH